MKKLTIALYIMITIVSLLTIGINLSEGSIPGTDHDPTSGFDSLTEYGMCFWDYQWVCTPYGCQCAIPVGMLLKF